MRKSLDDNPYAAYDPYSVVPENVHRKAVLDYNPYSGYNPYSQFE